MRTFITVLSSLALALASEASAPAQEKEKTNILQKEPPAKIIVDPPPAGPLSRGVAVIQFRTENLQVVPVFGPAALAVSPRIGHLHVTLDDAPWYWGHTSADPIIVGSLAPGRHKIRIQLANANHQPIDQGTVEFTVPAAKAHSPRPSTIR